VWEVLTRVFFQKLIGENSKVLDIGCGFCHKKSALRACEVFYSGYPGSACLDFSFSRFLFKLLFVPKRAGQVNTLDRPELSRSRDLMRSDHTGIVACGTAGRLVRDPVHLATFTGG